MPIVLVCAVAAEVKAVAAGLGLPAERAAAYSAGERATVVANGREIVLLASGIGPINAAWRLGELLAVTPGVAGVVNLGLAGSYDLGRAPLLASVAASQELWPEFGLRRGQDALAKALGFALHPKGPVFDALALDPARSASALGLRLPATWPKAPSVTVAGVSENAERAAFLAQSRAALTENMEGFPLALICHDKDLPFLEVRVMSNLAGSRLESDWRLRDALGELGRTTAILFGARDAS